MAERLFTMGDVRQIASMTRAYGAPSLEEIIDGLDAGGKLSIPPDEPVMVIRASDVTDRHALARRAEHTWDEMAEWRRTHG